VWRTPHEIVIPSAREPAYVRVARRLLTGWRRFVSRRP
jgi:hypothetical protein